MIRYNPFREMEALQQKLLQRNDGNQTQMPLTDILEDAQGVHLAVYLPGIDPQNVEVSSENRTLTVMAQRPFQAPQGQVGYRLEGSYGRFVRSFGIPAIYDLARVEANFRNGVLYIDIPKSEVAQARKIEVQVNA